MPASTPVLAAFGEGRSKHTQRSKISKKIPGPAHRRDLGSKVQFSREGRAWVDRTAKAAVPTWSLPTLHQTLVQHGVGDLQEASNVGAVYQVAGRAVFLGRFEAVLVDGDHDLVQTLVDLLSGPAQTRAILGHFEAGGRYAAGISCFGRSVKDLGIEKQLTGFQR